MKGLTALCASVMTVCATSFFASCERLDVLDGQVANLEGEVNDLQGQINKLDERLQAVEALKAQLEGLAARVETLEAVELKFQEGANHELQYSLNGGKDYTGTGIILATQTTVQFKVENNKVLFTQDGGKTWTETGVVTHEQLQLNIKDGQVQFSTDGGKTWNNTGIIVHAPCDNVFKWKKENGTLWFSEDDGKTWVNTEAIVDPCTKPEVKFEETDTEITVWVGDKSFVIEKPEKIEFEIKAGKVQFAYESTQQIAMKTLGIVDLTVISTPKGWSAEVDSEGFLVVTSPKEEDTQDQWDYDTWELIAPASAETEGVVKLYAVSSEGKCMVGKLNVELSDYPVVVTVTGGQYSIYAPQASMWNPVYYGVSTKETLEADFNKVSELVIAAEMTGDDPDWAYVVMDGDVPATGDIAEVFGAELVAGGEYLIWAANWMTITNKYFDDLTLAYYTHVDVAITEDASKKTAYEIYVSVDAKGADSYFATAIPENVGYDAATVKEMMIMDLTGDNGGGVAPLTKAPSSSFAKLYTEPYNGALSRIGSESVMLVPGTKCTLLVLPFNGRPYNQYTVNDFVEMEFTMNSLTEGGSVNAEVKQITSYTTETGREVTIDPYKELCVEFKPTSDAYKYAYFTFYPADEFDKSATDAEIVNTLLNAEGVTPYGKEEQFNGICQWRGLKPEDAMVFVGFFVDENDKYGKPVVLELATEAIQYCDMTFDVETNLVEGVLTGTTLSVAVKLPEGKTASTYKYYCFDATYSYSDYFKNSTEAEIVESAVLGDYKYYLKESSTAEFTVTNNRVGKKYFLAVIPYDENNLPVQEAWKTYYTVQAAE